jgi:transcriptional regulator with XRE-family HTH domain
MPSQHEGDYRLALGRAVARRRHQLKLTQEQLALKSDGLHQRWISNVENGKRNPSYGSLRRLALALELSTSQLVARAERVESRLQTEGRSGKASRP